MASPSSNVQSKVNPFSASGGIPGGVPVYSSKPSGGLLEVQPSAFPAAPSEALTVGLLGDKILELLDNPSVKEYQELAHILNLHFDALEALNQSTPLTPNQKSLYHWANKLLDPQGKVRDAVIRKLEVIPRPEKKEEKKKTLPPAPVAAPSKPVASLLSEIAFGKADWEEYFGDIGEEPPLPAAIGAMLESPCRYWSGKKVAETHFLVLIPATVNGKPLTLQRFEELVKKPKKGNAKAYRGFYREGSENACAVQSYWCLISRDVIPGSREKSYAAQLALVKKPDKPPRLIEMAALLFTHYVKTGERLYSSPLTYTQCQEKCEGGARQVTVGGFLPSNVSVGSFSNEILGLAVSRRF